MNALHSTAKTVETSWCQGSMKREAESKEAGDTYCAVGALVHNLAKIRGLGVVYQPEAVGTIEAAESYADEWQEWKAAGYPDRSPSRVERDLVFFDEFISETREGQTLALVILDNYADRAGHEEPQLSSQKIEDGNYIDVADIIIGFNDHDDTTREDVVAMMEKAALLLDDRAAAEDKTTDDLVEEINELINA